ncbi:MAG: pantoate--beta-alanine ligase [Candidatus Zixiibacteriota bacterium]
MKTTRSISTVRSTVTAWRRRGLTVGFVPTMGALHQGHRALMARARRLCDRTVVSIFVNPTQFGPRDDYSAYPRTWSADLAACRKERVDLVFAPTAETIYPGGFQTTVSLPALSRRWEGEARPRHFDGVATVVLKLFNILQPDLAIFGQKDFQQSVIIRRMVSDCHLPIRIVVVPTVRESDGLALSSRNVYLDVASRTDASAVYAALQWARAEIRHGTATAKRLRREMTGRIEATGRFAVDYIAFCDPETLEPKRRLKRPLVILIAAICRVKGRANGRRYIDNTLIR